MVSHGQCLKENAKENSLMFNSIAWQGFERIVGELFKMHDYSVEISKVVVKEKMKRQFDVIARKNGKTLLIDCKKWNKNRYKTSALKTAVEKQVERTVFYPGLNKTPLIVTWYDEDLVFHNKVPVVPVGRLNDFLTRIEDFDLERF